MRKPVSGKWPNAMRQQEGEPRHNRDTFGHVADALDGRAAKLCRIRVRVSQIEDFVIRASLYGYVAQESRLTGSRAGDVDRFSCPTAHYQANPGQM